MPLAKRVPTRKQHGKIAKAAAMTGVAGLSLSLASVAASAIPAPAQNPVETPPLAGHEMMLHEEEISEVSLATFHIFDKENAPSLRPRTRLAMGACGCGCSACGGCWTGTYYTSSIFGYYGNPGQPAKPARKHARVAKPAQNSKNE